MTTGNRDFIDFLIELFKKKNIFIAILVVFIAIKTTNIAIKIFFFLKSSIKKSIKSLLPVVIFSYP